MRFSLTLRREISMTNMERKVSRDSKQDRTLEEVMEVSAASMLTISLSNSLAAVEEDMVANKEANNNSISTSDRVVRKVDLVAIMGTNSNKNK